MEVDSNSFGRDHGREHPGDGLDRIQDPQGVLASQANIGTRRETQLSKYHIHNNRIWNGVVCHSPGSHCAYQPVSSESASFKGYCLAFDLVVSFQRMLNVIIRSVHFYSFVLLITVTFG